MHTILRGDSMRGLAVFISDIRNCKSKEAESKRVNKELANIRSKFKGDKSLDGYSKKKYICKLLFIFLLGHDVDFGHMEAVNLTTSNRYTEKQIGYLFISVLVSSNSTLLKLIIQNMKNDIKSKKGVYVNLALHCIANFSSVDMVEAFHTEIPKLLLSGQTTDTIKQSAALCFLQLFRTAPEKISHNDLAPRLIHLLNDHHMGVLTASVSLIHALAQHSPASYQACLPFAISRLNKIITSMYSDLQDYTYYFVPAPWLSIKLLKLLQCYPFPSDSATQSHLIETLDLVLSRSQEPVKSKKLQHSNAKNAILFEAINLIIHIQSHDELLIRACNQLGLFLLHRETNLRYLALEAMCRLAASDVSPNVLRTHQPTIINALKVCDEHDAGVTLRGITLRANLTQTERDVSVRQRAVDLLYAMCSCENVEDIVSEMLSHMEKTNPTAREEMALKIAVLSEKYATNSNWYVDTILCLIRLAGDYLADEVWHRLVQIVVNNEDVREYAAKSVFVHLQSFSCHESMVKVGAFILGEFGKLISRTDESSPKQQFHLLRSRLPCCSSETRAMLLSTFIKFARLFPEIKDEVQEYLQSEHLLRNADVEVQQRASEYTQLGRMTSSRTFAMVFEGMPPFIEKDSLLTKLKAKNPMVSKIFLKEEDKERLDSDSSAFNIKQVEKSLSAQSDDCDASKANSLLVDVALSSSSGGGGIIDIQARNFFDSSFSEIIPASCEPSPIQEAQYLSQFLSKNQGVLYEDNLIQIGVKSEFKEQFGRIVFFFGNKSSEQLGRFSASLQHTFNSLEKISTSTLKDPPATISPGSQERYVVNLECLKVFRDPLVLIVQYDHEGDVSSFSLKAPVLVNKFLGGVTMSASDFRARWSQLGMAAPETKVVFESKEETDFELIKSKIIGFGWTLLSDVDPDPKNLVGSGILKTSSAHIGCLLRLEPNICAMMHRITIRTSSPQLSPILTQLLQDAF